MNGPWEIWVPALHVHYVSVAWDNDTFNLRDILCNIFSLSRESTWKQSTNLLAVAGVHMETIYDALAADAELTILK